MTQLDLFAEPVAGPDLTTYQRIIISSSAGKDSQAMLHHVWVLCRALGIEDRLVCVHADLGDVEWEGTRELAHQQAEALGIRFEVVTRLGKVASVGGKVYAKGETAGDLLDYARRRGSWPDNKNRWCTSDFKRAPIRVFQTRIAEEYRAANPDHVGPVRVLDCLGLRAEESSGRAKKPTLVNQRSTRNVHVDTWLPIHGWSTEQVWQEIRHSALPHHRAYDLGMTRLSCVFCIFAPKKALVVAGRHNQKLLQRYLEVEQETGHLFRQDCSLASVVEEVYRSV